MHGTAGDEHPSGRLLVEVIRLQQRPHTRNDLKRLPQHRAHHGTLRLLAKGRRGLRRLRVVARDAGRNVSDLAFRQRRVAAVPIERQQRRENHAFGRPLPSHGAAQTGKLVVARAPPDGLCRGVRWLRLGLLRKQRQHLRREARQFGGVGQRVEHHIVGRRRAFYERPCQAHLEANLGPLLARRGPGFGYPPEVVAPAARRRLAGQQSERFKARL